MSETYTVEFHHTHDDHEYRVSAEYLSFPKSGRLTVTLDGGKWAIGKDGLMKQRGPVLEIEWYDWTDEFLDEGAFKQLVLSEMDGHWPLQMFGRRRPDGDVDVLYIADGSAVTRIDRDHLYPVNSDLGSRYEHAGGIVLSEEDAKRIGLEIEE